MTNEDRNDEETNEEAIEDLEAPAAAQDDVFGGAVGCLQPTCVSKDTQYLQGCETPSCQATAWECRADSHIGVLHEA